MKVSEILNFSLKITRKPYTSMNYGGSSILLRVNLTLLNIITIIKVMKVIPFFTKLWVGHC